MFWTPAFAGVTVFGLFTVSSGLHIRFLRQQGISLIPVDVRSSLHPLLKERITRHRLDRSDRLEYLSGLRNMNISRNSLFEGPDAWAISLKSAAWTEKKKT